MARLVTAGGMTLAALVAIGTWLYVQGIAPPLPLNAHTFNAAVLISILYALAFGRTRRP